MNDVQKMAMERAIDEQFAERMGWIQEEIFKGCLDTDSTEQVCAKMILLHKVSLVVSLVEIMEVFLWIAQNVKTRTNSTFSPCLQGYQI